MTDLDTTIDPGTMIDERHETTLPEMHHVMRPEADTRTGEAVVVVTTDLGTRLAKPKEKRWKMNAMKMVILSSDQARNACHEECLYSSTDSPFVRHNPDSRRAVFLFM